jgi:hypothetical protein
MIIKQIDPKSTTNKLLAAGVKAEKQMAFYLKRAYESSEEFCVINDLRLQMNDDIAQIDHLILHKYGFVIVESKSVSSKVSINEHDEWARHYGSKMTGMPSPVNQAKRQADFLKNFLMSAPVELLKKRKMFKVSFADFKYDTLVAVSDEGIIERHSKSNGDGIHKADQITSVIDLLHSSYLNKMLSLSLKVNYEYGPETRQRIWEYLLKSHTPKGNSLPENEVSEPKREEEKSPEASELTSKEEPKEQVSEVLEQLCSKCSSNDVNVAYGKFGYYFKCSSCDGNTAIKKTCKTKECKPKVRKEKLNFYKECSVCESSELFFVNKK